VQPVTELDRLLSKKQVVELTSLSYPTIWRQMRKGKFPQSIRPSEGRVAWRASDIKAWLDSIGGR
jgi:prophage regulatory protein